MMAKIYTLYKIDNKISMSNLAIKTNYFANLEKGLDELQADAIVPEE